MRVFLTGATGFIGSAIIPELLSAGHQVVGLARSDAAEEKLKSLGVDVLRGSLDDLDVLKRGATESDGVIHCAFIHDFSDYATSVKKDRIAVEAIGAALEGTNRPFIVTTGTLGLVQGKLAVEQDLGDLTSPLSARNLTEGVTLAFASKGVRATVIRLAPVIHGKGDHAFVPALIGIARQKGVSAYIGSGDNHWPSAHRLDIARLYRLILEKGKAGSRYHGVSDDLTPIRNIAEVIGKSLNIPVVSKTPQEAVEHFGFLGHLLGIDNLVSSKHTQEELGWNLVQPSLLLDVEKNYF